MRTILRRAAGGNGEAARVLLLNPNASDLLPLRKWATDRYIEVARRLLDRFPGAHIGLMSNTRKLVDNLADEVTSRDHGRSSISL